MMDRKQVELSILPGSLGQLLDQEHIVESKKLVFWKLKAILTHKMDLLPQQTELLAQVTTSQRDLSLDQSL